MNTADIVLHDIFESTVQNTETLIRTLSPSSVPSPTVARGGNISAIILILTFVLTIVIVMIVVWAYKARQTEQLQAMALDKSQFNTIGAI